MCVRREGGWESINASSQPKCLSQNPMYSGTPPYDHLVITTTFWCLKRIESLVISLILQPR